MTLNDNTSPSLARIGVAALITIAVAAIVLVVAVLPAEYGIDPLGTGRMLGLDALASANEAPTETVDPVELEPVRPGANTSQTARFKRDTVEFELGPFEGIEYKYRIEKGGSMVYSWTSTGPVNFDFHGEPDGAKKGYAESYEQQKGVTAAHGTFNTPTPGIHGWFWENQGSDVITVRLSSAGFYSVATEFREDGPKTHTLKDE
jgi:hypothetical protein